MSKTSPYRSLSPERRLSIVTRAMTHRRELRAALIQRMVARGGGFRAVTLQSWPVEKLAREIVRMKAESPQDELDLLHMLYVELEPAIQTTFLDAAGVRHEEAKIAEELEPPFADEAAVARAAKVVEAQHGAEGRQYLDTIALYNLASWPGLDRVLAEMDSASDS
ncbi:MAG: hypothetical protein M3081_15055 [Gemmatimonadota bacterium]|nr:hypothetical protein [Gemmatimonadota bacterium]